MSNLEDIREKGLAQAKHYWERFEESSIYHKLKDRYENLTPLSQKLLTGFGTLLLLGLIFSLPFSYYSSSSEQVDTFDKRRGLIRDLLKSSREAMETPDIPLPPSLESAKSQIDEILRNSKLLPEQIIGIEVSPENSGLIPQDLAKGTLKVILSQLNLRQVIDIGFQIQNLSQSLKLKDLFMDRSPKNNKYFNVIYKITSLNVPEPPPPPPADPIEEKPKSKKSKTGDE